MGLRKLGIIIQNTLLFVLLAISPVRADSPTVSNISQQLMCQCGCGRALDSHVCATQEAMTAVIRQKIAQGQSAEQIIQSFVAQYGEQVLSSPPKQGFNLTVWVTPFAVLLIGAGIVYSVLKGWAERGKQTHYGAAVETQESDQEYQHRLEKELEEFSGRGFR